MASDEAKPRTARCPICQVPTEREWRPFCSRRCADIDLGRWMTGRYAIPAEDEAGAAPERSGEEDWPRN